MRLRRPGEPSSGREVAHSPSSSSLGAVLSIDGAVVPAALLLVARDLLLHDPPRVLAWRLLHEPALAERPPWLEPLVPSPSGAFDRDPIAMLLAALAVGLAAAYLIAALVRARVAIRAALLGSAALALVVLPTLAFVAMGAATGRPYGQDGGVVQLPLALDRILEGKSPYGADYADSMLGKQARASDFWAPYGGNPILRHHAYLPGTHLVMMPFYLVGRAIFGGFDPRFVTLLAWGAAAWLATRLVIPPERRLAAAAAVLVNPLLYWHQIFGANDLVVAALLLATALLIRRGRSVAAAVALGLACATKQLAWPFAPFLLAHMSGARTLRDLVARPALARLAGPAATAALVFAVVVGAVAALDPRAFWADIAGYNLGFGADRYPLGGTPGIGFANFLVVGRAVSSLRDGFPFALFYVLLIPLGVLLLRLVLREGTLAAALAAGSAALMASIYFSRIPHANYFVLAAALLPAAFLMGHRAAADVAVAPLLLLALAVEVAEGELFRAAWSQAMPPHPLARDPFSLIVSALAAGIAVLYIADGLLGAPATRRRAWLAVAAGTLVVAPALFVVWSGIRTGVVRAQDDWTARVVEPAPAVEAWSTSFRREPPGPVRATSEHETPTRRVPVKDPRPLTLAAAGLAAYFLARLAPPEARLLVLAGSMLSPAIVIAVVFGSPQPIVLAGMAGTALLARARATLLMRLLAGGLLAAIAVALVAGGPGWSEIGPGLGLFNVFLYWGVEQVTAPIGLTLAAMGIAGAVALAWRLRVPDVAVAAAAWLVGLWFWPSAAPHALAIPLALIVLAATPTSAEVQATPSP